MYWHLPGIEIYDTTEANICKMPGGVIQNMHDFKYTTRTLYILIFCKIVVDIHEGFKISLRNLGLC